LFAGLLLVTTVMLLVPHDEASAGAVDDKVGHLLAFAVLALVGRWARVPTLPLLLGLAAYAGATELLQAVLPFNRHGDLRDVLADLVGLLVGTLVAMTVSLVLARVGARSRSST
jgi:VanZ family protein